MKSFSRFWHELKRRNVLKRIISYVVFSWLVIQVISTVSSLISLPVWLGKVSIILLLIFFPIWVTFSWFYDISPTGLKKIITVEGEIDTEQKVAISKRLNIFILVFLSLAVLLLVVDRTRLISNQQKIQVLTINDNLNSIAVLPFKDISANNDQAYFADGLAEELINNLSKISNIKVTSRTSAFSFKGKTIDIPTIAKQLNVNYILEGSIRTSDSIIRVNVQLINTKDDSYTWSQTWDKKMESVFKIQDEISQIVAQKLELEITENFINPEEEVNPEAYRLFLKANYEIKNFEDEDSFTKSENFLKQSIALDSLFAPTWTLLSYIYHQKSNEGLITIEEGYSLAKNAALKAVEVDSTYATVYDILGTIAIDYEKDYTKAQQLVNKGLSLEPKNPHVMRRASEVALILGDPKKALEYNLQLVSLDPLDEPSHFWLGMAYYFSQNYAKAEESYKKSIKLDPETVHSYNCLSIALLFQNRFEEALKAAKKEPVEALRLQSLVMVYQALGDKEKSISYLSEFIEKYEENWSYQIACIYAFKKENDNAFLWLDKAIYYKDFGIIEAIIDPLFFELKKDERWQEFLNKSKSLSLSQKTIVF